MSLNPVGPQVVKGYTTVGSDSEIPRALLVVAGYEFTPKGVEIVNNTHGVLDTATVTLPISSNPDLSTLFKPKSDKGSVVGQIYIGFPGISSLQQVSVHQLQRRFWGIVDTTNPDFGISDVVRLEFRSMGVLLEVTKHTNTSFNETGVQVAAAAAKLVGLKFVSKLAPGRQSATLAEVFGRDLAVGVQTQRLWDTIVACAEIDDVDAFVRDDTLYYVSPLHMNYPVLSFTFGKDLKDFTGKHADQANNNIRVEVRTWNPRKKTSYTVRKETGDDGTVSTTFAARSSTTTPNFGTNSSTTTSGASTSGSSTSGGIYNTGITGIPRASSAEKYIIRKPYLTNEQANKLAETTRQQIARHEYTADFTIIPTKKNWSRIGAETLYEIYNAPYYYWNARVPNSSLYYPRRTTIKFDGPQMGNSQGLVISVEAINHLPPSTGS